MDQNLDNTTTFDNTSHCDCLGDARLRCMEKNIESIIFDLIKIKSQLSLAEKTDAKKSDIENAKASILMWVVMASIIAPIYSELMKFVIALR